MKIYTCYKELDKARKDMESALTKLSKESEQMITEVEQLGNRGWKDAKYMNLKNVMIKNSGEINQTIVHLKKALDELNQRYDIVKRYYEIPL
jgi:prefoldin subunit 5